MEAGERTTGIILRTRPLTESSLIVQWLTADAGRVATVAKGARRAKSVFRGKLDLFYEAELLFRRSRRSELHTLGEVMPLNTRPGLRMDWHKLTQAAYGVALIEQSTETDTPMPETWELFRGFLAEVEAAAATPLTILALELRHLADLGQLPDFGRESLAGSSRVLAGRLLEVEWGAWRGKAVAAGTIEPLVRFLGAFLIHHLGKLPRGRAEALGSGPAADLCESKLAGN